MFGCTKSIAFEIIAAASVKVDGTKYRIAFASNTYYVLDAARTAPEIGANVSIWHDNGGLNQLWKLVPTE